MKKFICLLFSLSLLTFISCQKDETTDPSSDIYDTWNCNENSTTFGTQNYHVDISKDPSSSDKVVIDNFFNLGLGKSIKATLAGQTLTINNENLDGNTFNGTGTVSSNNNSITWQYTFDDGNGPENVNATYTRL